MFLDISPSVHRRFIAEEGKRENLAGLVDALEPFDGDETIDFIEQRPQLGREIEIALFVPRLWPDFEDHRDHSIPRRGTVTCGALLHGGRRSRPPRSALTFG